MVGQSRAECVDGTVETVSSCPLCGGSELLAMLEAADLLYGTPGRWTVRRCLQCGLMMTSPRPARAAMGAYYPPAYSPHATGWVPESVTAWRRVVRRVLAPLIDSREEIIPARLPPGWGVEIGCGAGRFLARMRERRTVFGVERTPAVALRAHRLSGATVVCGDNETVSFAEGSLAFVAAFMVLEHLHDPFAVLGRVVGWLKPGGVLVGSVPNAGSWEFRAFGPEWYALQVPTHLFHFTPRTLRRSLEASGFISVRVVHQRNISNLAWQLGRAVRHWGWRAERLERFGEGSSRLVYWSSMPLALLLSAMRQGGRLSFSARVPA